MLRPAAAALGHGDKQTETAGDHEDDPDRVDVDAGDGDAFGFEAESGQVEAGREGEDRAEHWTNLQWVTAWYRG